MPLPKNQARSAKPRLARLGRLVNTLIHKAAHSAQG